jgi:hypothetical protein
MSLRVPTAEKKADIAKDLVVAYLSHADPELLADLDKVDAAIARLVDAVDQNFEVPEKAHTGFGLPPTLPRPTA